MSPTVGDIVNALWGYPVWVVAAAWGSLLVLWGALAGCLGAILYQAGASRGAAAPREVSDDRA